MIHTWNDECEEMGLTVLVAFAIESEQKRCWASLYMGFMIAVEAHVAAT